MRYEHYSPEDFITDDEFVQWVKNPTDALESFWSQWISEHPEKKQTVESARKIILSVRYKNQYQPSQADFDAVWKNIQAHRTAPETSRSTRPLWPALTRIAAVVVLSIASLLTWKYLKRDSATRQEALAETSTIQWQAAKGEKKQLMLPDGSKITLNADSRIVYNSDFGKTHRDLTLDGEAFFDVAPDKTRPFSIHTSRLTTTVVGTSFNINAYKENPEIRVAVQTGRVEVANELNTQNESLVRLRPQQMSVFDKTDKELAIRSFDPQTELGWLTDRISLKNADFEQIKRVLERQYAVTFVVDKGLKVKEEFNATFENASIDKILDALNYTSEFHYKLVKNKVFVTKKEK